MVKTSTKVWAPTKMPAPKLTVSMGFPYKHHLTTKAAANIGQLKRIHSLPA